MDADLLQVVAPALDPVVGHAAAATLGVVFILGALHKLREPEIFRDAVENYRIVPKRASALVARALPLAEAVAGVAIVLVATRAWGALLALALLAVVTVAVAINVRRGRTRIDCGCGGDQHLPLGGGLVARNLVLMAVAALALLPSSGRPTVWLDFAATAFCLLSALALFALGNALIRNHARLVDLRNAP